MARAGDATETEVVSSRNSALEHASKVGDPDGYDHQEAAYDHAQAARDARDDADEREGTVGEIYDRTKDLSTVTP